MQAPRKEKMMRNKKTMIEPIREWAIVTHVEWVGHRKWLRPKSFTEPAIIEGGYALCGLDRVRKRISADSFVVHEHLDERGYRNAIRRLRYAKKAAEKKAAKKALEVKLSKTGRVLYSVGPATEGAFSVPQGVEKIKSGAFRAIWKLTEIEFPASLKEIEVGAFSDLPRLKKADVPQGIKVSPAAFGPNCGSAGREARARIRGRSIANTAAL